MNLPTVPTVPQYHSMYDGSKAINQNEQVQFNIGVQTAIQQLNAAVLELAGSFNKIRDTITDQLILYKHFQDFVHDHHPDVFEEYVASTLVQAKLEISNGN